mmetsp:Transcript_43867/g.137843  ORF Transcript_43867/g.137843 Transcript_43867/m.137843 type:complete len:893 (+) Transcript_43867:1398-4076(+)
MYPTHIQPGGHRHHHTITNQPHSSSSQPSAPPPISPRPPAGHLATVPHLGVHAINDLDHELPAAAHERAEALRLAAERVRYDEGDADVAQVLGVELVGHLQQLGGVGHRDLPLEDGLAAPLQLVQRVHVRADVELDGAVRRDGDVVRVDVLEDRVEDAGPDARDANLHLRRLAHAAPEHGAEVLGARAEHGAVRRHAHALAEVGAHHEDNVCKGVVTSQGAHVAQVAGGDGNAPRLVRRREGQRCRVLVVACDAADAHRREALNLRGRRELLRAAMAELSVVAVAPGVDVAFVAQSHAVAPAARDLRHHHAARRRFRGVGGKDRLRRRARRAAEERCRRAAAVRLRDTVIGRRRRRRWLQACRSRRLHDGGHAGVRARRGRVVARRGAQRLARCRAGGRVVARRPGCRRSARGGGGTICRRGVGGKLPQRLTRGGRARGSRRRSRGRLILEGAGARRWLRRVERPGEGRRRRRWVRVAALAGVVLGARVGLLDEHLHGGALQQRPAHGRRRLLRGCRVRRGRAPVGAPAGAAVGAHDDAWPALVVVAGEVHDQRRAVAVRLVGVAELAVLAAAPGEEQAAVGDGGGVEAAAAHLDDLLAHERLDAQRRRLVALVAVPEPAELALAPGVDLAVAERRRVKAAGADLRALEALEVRDDVGRVLVPLDDVRSVAADAVLAVAPGVDVARREQRHRVPRAAGHLRHLDVAQALHERRPRAAVLVAVPELAVHAAAPREELARVRHRRRVVAAAGDLRDAEAPQLLHAPRHVLPAVVAVAEAAVVAAAPRVHVALLEQHHCVPRAARDLPHAAVAQRVHEARLILVRRVTEAQLPILAAAPGVDLHGRRAHGRIPGALLPAAPLRDDELPGLQRVLEAAHVNSWRPLPGGGGGGRAR